MTSDLTETARRVVQLHGWRPSPGWADTDGARYVTNYGDADWYVVDSDGSAGVYSPGLPDLSDDATLGILAACARRWQGCDVSVLRVPGGWQLVDPWHMEQCTRWGPVCDHPAQCYAFALEADPRGQR